MIVVLGGAVLFGLAVAGLPLGFQGAGPSWLRAISRTEVGLLGGGAFVVPALVLSILVEYVRFARMAGPPVAVLRYVGALFMVGAWAVLADAVAGGSAGLIGSSVRGVVAEYVGLIGWTLWLAVVLCGVMLVFGLSLITVLGLVGQAASGARLLFGNLRTSLFAMQRGLVTRHHAVAASAPVGAALVPQTTGSKNTQLKPVARPGRIAAPVIDAPVKPVIEAAPMPVIRSVAPRRVTSPAQEVVRPSAPTGGLGASWSLPGTSMLGYGTRIEASQESMFQRADKIVRTLAEFGIAARVQEIRPGPTVTQFGVRPDPGVKVAKIVGLQNDLALSLEAHSIRVEAPVPGKPYVGIEVPNPIMTPVTLRELLESPEFVKFRGKGARLPVAVGSDVAGDPVFGDLTRMPHVLVAGATGAGKSVFINALITCLLFHCSPEELQLIMVDPKQVELTGYNGIPHLKAPVIVDVDKVVGALDWCIKEMERRYSLFAQGSFRDVVRFNDDARAKGEATLPYIVVIIDELADLMMTAPDQVEQQICRLAQKARATGIHLVVATQRPSVDVITGLIKANFPSRIAFAVSSGVDSKTIIDSPGAERLLGRGDMLYTPADVLRPMRVQGTWVNDQEIEALVTFWRAQRELQGERWQSPEEQRALLESWSGPVEVAPEDRLIEDAEVMLQGIVDAAAAQGRTPEVTVSLMQRRLRLGQARANLLLDELYDRGLVGTPHGPTRSRTINLTPSPQADEPQTTEALFPGGDHD